MKLILISILVLISVNSNAKQKQSRKSPSQSSKLSTDIKFNGHNVGGKTQSPFESLAEVENEKTIFQLIAVRKDFSDRIQKHSQLR